MSKNPILILLLGLIFSVFCWYAASTTYKIYNYRTLSETAKTLDIQWFVEEISDEDFRVGATYSFKIDDEIKKGETIFTDHRYRNPSSADDELKIKKEKSWLVFFDQNNPDHSSLEKSFPIKNFLYTLFLFILFLYFFGLGIYTSAKESKP